MNISLSGYLKTPDNQPMAEANILFTAVKTSSQTLKSISASVTTDENGYYEVDVSYGTFDIKVKQKNRNAFQTIATDVRINDSTTASTLNGVILENLPPEEATAEVVLQIESLKSEIATMKSDTQSLRDEVVGIEINLQDSVDTIDQYDTRLTDLENSVGSLSGMQDVTLTSAANGDVLSFDGTEWVNSTVDSLLPEFTVSDITGLQAALDDKTATGHGHVIADVTGLQTALDGKAPSGHTHVLGDITNVQDSATDGQILQYDEGSATWIPTSYNPEKSMGQLSNVTDTGIGEGQVLQWDGTNYVPYTIPIAGGSGDGVQYFNDLADVSVNGAVSGEFVYFNGATFSTKEVYIPSNLSGLTDVDVNDPQSGEILSYNSVTSRFENIEIPSSGAFEVNELTDVTVSGLVDDQILQYDTGVQKWVNKTLPNYATDIYSLGGVNITSPTAGQILKRVGVFWENASVQISEIPNLQSSLDAKADTTHSHTIAKVTGLQTALDGKAPNVHTHTMSQVSGLQAALDGKANNSHTHAIVDVTGLQAALDGKTDNGHTHVVSDITDLQAALDDKTDVGHSHAIADTAGLQSALDSKALTTHTHVVADITDIQPILDAKSDASHTHVIEDIDLLQAALDGKTDTGHTHEIADTNGLQDALNGKTDLIHTHEIDDINGLQTQLNNKASDNHSHPMEAVDGLDTALSMKSDMLHTHTISGVDGLQAALDSKLETVHTHVIADVTGLQGELDGLDSKIDNFSLTNSKDLKNAVAKDGDILYFDSESGQYKTGNYFDNFDIIPALSSYTKDRTNQPFTGAAPIDGRPIKGLDDGSGIAVLDGMGDEVPELVKLDNALNEVFRVPASEVTEDFAEYESFFYGDSDVIVVRTGSFAGENIQFYSGVDGSHLAKVSLPDKTTASNICRVGDLLVLPTYYDDPEVANDQYTKLKVYNLNGVFQHDVNLGSHSDKRFKNVRFFGDSPVAITRDYDTSRYYLYRLALSDDLTSINSYAKLTDVDSSDFLNVMDNVPHLEYVKSSDTVHLYTRKNDGGQAFQDDIYYVFDKTGNVVKFNTDSIPSHNSDGGAANYFTTDVDTGNAYVLKKYQEGDYVYKVFVYTDSGDFLTSITTDLAPNGSSDHYKLVGTTRSHIVLVDQSFNPKTYYLEKTLSGAILPAYVKVNGENSDIPLASLKDVDSNLSPSNSQVLSWDSANAQWVASTILGAESNLSDINDVRIVAPLEANQILGYDGTEWINQDVSDLVDVASVTGLQAELDGKLDTTASISDLSDVDTSGIAQDQVLSWDGTTFVPTNMEGTSSSLTGIQDAIKNAGDLVIETPHLDERPFGITQDSNGTLVVRTSDKLKFYDTSLVFDHEIGTNPTSTEYSELYAYYNGVNSNVAYISDTFVAFNEYTGASNEAGYSIVRDLSADEASGIVYILDANREVKKYDATTQDKLIGDTIDVSSEFAGVSSVHYVGSHVYVAGYINLPEFQGTRTDVAKYDPSTNSFVTSVQTTSGASQATRTDVKSDSNDNLYVSVAYETTGSGTRSSSVYVYDTNLAPVTSFDFSAITNNHILKIELDSNDNLYCLFDDYVIRSFDSSFNLLHTYASPDESFTSFIIGQNDDLYATSGEDAGASFRVRRFVTQKDSLVMGNATGGDQGGGSINAEAIYVNGNEVYHAGNPPAGGGGGATQLNELSDVTLTSALDGEVLTWDSTGSQWINQTPTFAGLTDVTLDSPTNDSFLTYDAFDEVWRDRTFEEANVARATHNHDGDYATVNHVHSFDSLSDVTITAPTNGQMIRFNGSQFVNEAVTIPTSASDLSDIDTTGITTDQVLKFNGTNFVPSDVEAQYDDKSDSTISAGSVTFDLASPTSFVVNMDQDITSVTFSNAPADKFVVFSIAFIQDATGGRTVTWPAEMQGTPAQPNGDPDSVTIMSFATFDGGTTIYQAGA